MGCGLGLIRRGDDKVLRPRRGEYLSGAISEFNLLFPAPESGLNKEDVD